ncbi:host cell division inhibitor Icd-like protein [Cronobacter sakazakii]|uniref:host cell division inhibitor Icd-like protein n=1 Tax=Cronobacter sakazakii TaxID=28141 RepID=UPI000BEA30D5|nr:host cell division inhibitor Icd-like protein [Cronobacter sakazakii]PQV83719.1 Ash-like/host cell division inhibitor Icd-like protein [Cronobacter sakazakii]PQV91054.1 Ash-like/host cell division inhibitor Icd-like protein [Cronobacter sakazakii]PQX96573.1 Ash-like/host cell division inhibitor Icd-like protein [Cronobacter sakazakii]PUV60604.1 Ash-like/host cell division inhibitor Icd-like protein [Cronobacter sakazakii]
MAGRNCIINQQNSVIKPLRLNECAGYSFPAAAKSAAGRRNPSLILATQHAPRVFFCVFAFVHPFYGQWFSGHCTVCVMVVRAGQPSGWPVSKVAGIPTPVRATTSERRNSGGSFIKLTLENAFMATVVNSAHPEFTFLFLAVRRADCGAQPLAVRVNAGTEYAARAQLISDYVLCFAGRLPVCQRREVRA